jgi:DNA-directed RNA polymerase specialized sigma24 family protein
VSHLERTTLREQRRKARRKRDALILLTLDCYSQREVAAMFGLSPARVCQVAAVKRARN